MAKVINTIILHNDYVEVISETFNYKHSILLDTEDLPLLGKMRVTNRGYAYTCKGGHNVAHTVMGHSSNTSTVVDHKNGNTLDNRKGNLRVVTSHANSQNKHQFIRNNTGVVGISYRENGKYAYYRVSLTDRSKGKDSNRQGKRSSKQFNINKLGKDVAFIEAQKYLAAKKIELGYLV